MTKTQVLFAPRIGKEGKLRVGCSATIFDTTRDRVLLTQRADNGQWCMPGGGIDPGESAAEACVREVFEETGLEVKIIRLIGFYSSPDYLVVYPDGNKVQIIAGNFEVVVRGGALKTSDEVTAYGYFSQEEIAGMDILPTHVPRIRDIFDKRGEAYFD